MDPIGYWCINSPTKALFGAFNIAIVYLSTGYTCTSAVCFLQCFPTWEEDKCSIYKVLVWILNNTCIFLFLPFPQQNPWPCIPVNRDYFIPMEIKPLKLKEALGSSISAPHGHLLPCWIETCISLYHWWISCGIFLQVILSSILATCVCSFIDEAAAVISNNSGYSTLEYNITCQCKQPSCCGSITPLKAAIQWYAWQSYCK